MFYTLIKKTPIIEFDKPFSYVSAKMNGMLQRSKTHAFGKKRCLLVLLMTIVICRGLNAQNTGGLRYFNLVLPDNSLVSYDLADGVDIQFQDSIIIVNGLNYPMGNFVKYFFSVNRYYSLIVEADSAEGGIVTGGGMCEAGQTCTVTATANEGYTFINWTRDGEIVSTEAVYSFSVMEDASYVANFAKLEVAECNIIIDLYDSYGDAWEGNYLVVNYGGENQQLAVENGSFDSYTLSIPDGAHVVLSWVSGSHTEDCSFTMHYSNGNVICHGDNLNNDFLFEFDMDCEEMPYSECNLFFDLYDSYGDAWEGNYLVVNYGDEIQQLAVESGSLGTYTLWIPNGSHVELSWISGSHTEDCSFTVSYSNGNVVCHGENLNNDFSFEFDMDCEEMPTTTYSITAVTIPAEGGVVTGAGTYTSGATATLIATANTGYSFINWTKDGEELSNSEIYSFTVLGDASFVANFEQDVVIIGSGTATNEYLPSYSYYEYNLSQQIYTAEEIGGDGTINSIAFYNTGETKTRSYDVYMVHTNIAVFESNTDWIAVTEADRVFSGEVTMTSNVWTELQLDTPFQYDGVSNIALVVDDNSGNYTNSPHMTCRVFDTQGNQAIRIYGTNLNYDPCNPSEYTGTLHSVKNQIKLNITPSGGSFCPRPIGLSVTNITGHSATLNWNGTSENYNVLYRTAAYLDGIDEEFSNTSIPAGWVSYSGQLNDGTATLSSSSSWSFGESNGIFNSHARVNIYSTNCYKWLVTPAFTVPAESEFRFDLALTAYSGNSVPAPQTTGTDDKFIVLISTDNMTNWTTLREWNNSGSIYVFNNIAHTATGENVTIDLSAFADQNVRIAFYVESTASNADNNLHIDNVTMGKFYEAGEWHTVTTDEVPFQLTGLTSMTLYEVKVQSDCGSEAGMSGWSNIVSFMPTNVMVIGSGTATNSYLPTYYLYKQSLTQQIYTPAELGGAGLIERIDFNVSQATTKERTFDIYMVSTEKSSFENGTDWITVTESDKVYNGTLLLTQGWNTFTLNKPFNYDGVQNVAIIVDAGASEWESGPTFLVFDAPSQALRVYSDGIDYNPLAPTSYSGTVLNVKNQMRILISHALHFVTVGSWSEASNWQGGRLPSPEDEVCIDAPCQLDQDATVDVLTVSDGQSLTLQSGKTLTVINALTNMVTTGLVIEDGAQLKHASENVSATVKKNIAGHGTGDGKFYLISNPLVSTVDPNLANVYFLTSGNYDLYDWLASAADRLEWRNFKDNAFLIFPNGYGYLYANQDGVELNFPGVLRPSQDRFAKSVSYDAGDAEHPGWNLIGNPFMCNAYLVNGNNEPLPYYRMNAAGDGFEAVTSGTAIAPMEGVFYKASGNGTVYFIRAD